MAIGGLNHKFTDILVIIYQDELNMILGLYKLLWSDLNDACYKPTSPPFPWLLQVYHHNVWINSEV